MGFVQGTSGGAASNTATTTAFGSAVTAGNMLVVVATNNGSATNTISDSAFETFTNIYSASPGGTVGFTTIHYALNVLGGSGRTVTATSSGASQISLVVQEFSGIPTSGAFDHVSTSATGTSNAPTSNTASATLTNELVIGAMWYNNGATASLGSGFSNLTSKTQGSPAQYNCAIESLIATGTGSQTAVFSLSASIQWLCICATFKTTSSGGALTPLPYVVSQAVKRAAYY